MAEPHARDDAHPAPNFQAYIYVFLALSVCTILSFALYGVLGQGMTSASLIMIVAIIKAGLVAWIFMHVKFDWKRIYFLIIPVLILGVMLMVVLLPDIVIIWHQ